MSTLNELLARAQEVRDEQAVGGNTALRVGQLLTDIIQWCADTDADFVESVEHYVALLNERDGIINWWQSRVLILKTMGSDFDDVDVSTLNDGDLYYDNVGQWLFERENGGSANGHHPSEGVLYVNLATKTAYQWNGTSFQVAIEGGGGASSVTAFAQYSVVESTSELPSVGDPTTGYIVGTHIYAYVNTGGDTKDGKYQDLGTLETAGVSVTTNQDGTFTIHVGETDYTINLNHTHEDMVKLEKVTEATLPQTFANDTIYVQVDNLTTPHEIEALHIFGLEFTGGGVAPGTPAITKPSGSSVNLGENSGSGVSKEILIKANAHITGDLTVTLASNSDLSFDTTNLPTGVTYNSGAGTLTIAQVNAIAGVQIPIVYSGSGAAEIDGGLVISGGGATPKSVVVVVVVAPVQVAGVKLTGTQWLETDYRVNANTKVVMRVTFATNSFTQTTSNRYYYLSCREKTSGDAGNFIFYAGIEQENPNGPFNFCGGTGGSSAVQSIARASLLTPNSTIEIYGSTMSFIPNGGTAIAKALSPAISSMANPMVIGYYISNGDPRIFNTLDLTIHELTISEGSEVKRHYVPATLQGVPGLHDTVTGAFISSKTSTELEVVQ